MKNVIVILVVIIVAIGALSYFDPDIYQFFGIRYENATSNIMQNNISYLRGKTEYLTRLKLEYVKEKDPSVKTALKETYEQELSTIDNSKLPPNLLNIGHK